MKPIAPFPPNPALPFKPPAAALSGLHLLGRFSGLHTGAERELLDIQRLIAGRRPVRLWSELAPHRGFAGRGIAMVQPFSHQFPKDGVLLIGGVHVRPGVWLKYTRFERILVFCNLANHALLFALITDIREATGLEPELVFVSRMLQQSVGLPGRVSHSLMDLAPFLAVADQRGTRVPRLPLQPFVVGRVSRDDLDKHHRDDPALYRMLASQGVQVRIMGGTCLAPALEGVAGIELLPAGAEPVAAFYASLDAFFYRTGASVEAYGRVVAEAMASGLPVVAHRRGGYAEIVDEGRSGFLIDTQEQAYDMLMRLRASATLCQAVGAGAVQRASEIHGPQATAQALDFYLR